MLGKLPALIVIAVIAATLVAAAAPARADVAAGCPDAALSQPFAPWLDPGQYGLVPGGDFESHNSDWSFDGAAVTDGNEPWTVSDQNDRSSLLLSAGGTATTPEVCLGIEDPTLRFFVRNDGSPLSALQVSATYDGIGGQPVTVPVATVTAGAAWQPSQQVPVLLNLLSAPVASDGSTEVRFAFTPVGIDGEWSIDDVYLDPFKTK